MAFNAGAVIGTASLNTTDWTTGVKKMVTGVASFALITKGVKEIASAFVDSVEAADEWQKKLSNVNTLLDTSAVNTQDMAKSLLSLDSRLGSTTELTDAMYQSFSAGSSTVEEALTVTTDAATFAGAALTDTATAVDVLTSAQNAYGAEVVSTSEASDIFFTTIKEGKITGEQLAASIGNSIPTFSALNIPLEELGASMAAMTKQGISASVATTELNAITTSFLGPTESLTAALEAQGYASGDALLEAEGLSGALAFLEGASGGSSTELKSLLSSTESVKGVMALTGTGGEEFASILDSMGDSAGATQEAFDKQEMTFDTLNTSMSKIELVAGNIGKYFVDDIAAGATQAADSMLTFVMSGTMAEIVGNLVGGVSAAFSGLSAVMEPVTSQLLPTFRDIVESVAGHLEELKGEQESNIGAFDVLGAAAQFSASSFEVAAAFIQMNIDNLFNFVKIIQESAQTIGSVKDLLTGKATFGEVKANAAEAWTAMQDFGTGVVENGKEVWSTLRTEVTSFSDNAKTNAIEIEAATVTSYTNQKASVLTNWGEMITGQQAGFSELLADVTTGNTQIVEKTGEANAEVVQGTEETTATLKELWNSHFDSFTLSASDAFSTFSSVASSAMSGVTTLVDLETSNQLDAVTIQYAEEEAALDAKLAAGLISEDEYDTAIEAMEEEQLAKENAINEAAFESNKKLQIAGVAMDTAKSVSSWWSTAGALGPIAGPIFAGVMTAASIGMGVAQTSLISQTQYVPEYAEGGMASGTIRMNEEGGEIVTLPDGSQVVPNDISQQIASAAGASAVDSGNVINFYGDMTFSSEEMVDYFVDEVSRRIGKDMRAAI